jgi:hypothetical protein
VLEDAAVVLMVEAVVAALMFLEHEKKTFFS